MFYLQHLKMMLRVKMILLYEQQQKTKQQPLIKIVNVVGFLCKVSEDLCYVIYLLNYKE